jgi:hypothetical protein
VGRFIYTIYWEILSVEHCWIIYLHKILGLLSVEHWEDLFTQNTKEYVLMNTVGRLFTQNTGIYIVFNTVGRFIYTKYWEILYVEHCGKIYLHTILGNTLC